MPYPGPVTSLPERFYASLTPAPMPHPRLLRLNEPLAEELGLDTHWLKSGEGIAFLSHGDRPDHRPPLAMAYAGHQFGHFNPSLGDGRAMLIGDVSDSAGHQHEIQLKGSGPTPFSRRGDGRAVLGPVLREYIVSEAMHALGIPTTRALAALKTGETVWRETALPGAIVARVARSHMRVGTFQYFAARDDQEAMRILIDQAIERLYPEMADASERALSLLRIVMERQAALVARWMLVGFVHGVMNTDNMAISGETIDFGPCAFLDHYDPNAVFSFIDENGRYAYGRQPDMALWNLGRLAETLLPHLHPDPEQAIANAREVLAGFDEAFNRVFLEGWRQKLGLSGPERADPALTAQLLTIMHRTQADFTQTFRMLGSIAAKTDDSPFLALFPEESGIHAWLASWRARTERDPLSPTQRQDMMMATNPRIIPRNHQIEAIIQAALQGNYAPFHTFTEALSDPFSERDDTFGEPPAPHERILNTFCGT